MLTVGGWWRRRIFYSADGGEGGPAKDGRTGRHKQATRGQTAAEDGKESCNQESISMMVLRLHCYQEYNYN